MRYLPQHFIKSGSVVHACYNLMVFCLQGGTRAGFRYSVAVEQPQPRHRPKGKKSAAHPQTFALTEEQDGFDTIEVALTPANLAAHHTLVALLLSRSRRLVRRLAEKLPFLTRRVQHDAYNCYC